MIETLGDASPFRCDLIDANSLCVTTPAGNTLMMTKAQALAFAAQMVLLCDGSLVTQSNAKDRVTKWNTDSPFHRAYQDLVMPERV